LGADMPPRPMTTKPGIARLLTRKLSQLVTLAPDEIGIPDDLQSSLPAAEARTIGPDEPGGVSRAVK